MNPQALQQTETEKLASETLWTKVHMWFGGLRLVRTSGEALYFKFPKGLKDPLEGGGRKSASG
ncbi:rCG53410 [Rattus norvegicus]|uniref:RCG53410 n=1 Tax=Rattus norvegicus TaxID=10116 RepID=A6JRS9_RAT|nr:rCG53410 [Rattus norvegicus]